MFTNLIQLTYQAVLIVVVVVVVVLVAVVVVVVRLVADSVGVRRTERLEGLLPKDEIVVRPTQKTVVLDGELVTGHQRPTADVTPETVDVIDLVTCSHHEIVDTEYDVTSIALGAEQSAAKNLL